MKRFYLDTEFIEGKQKPSFLEKLIVGESKPTIDLISIGIVSDNMQPDGKERSYYAVSKDFNLNEAWNRFQYAERTNVERSHHIEPKKIYWLRDNVLKTIWKEMFLMQECDYALLNKREADIFEKELESGLHDNLFTFKSLKGLLQKYGKSNSDIAIDVTEFVYDIQLRGYTKEQNNTKLMHKIFTKDPIEFYGYYADYDWVVFCWLFGLMIDLPIGFPMYCNDLKQEMHAFEQSLYLGSDLRKEFGFPVQINNHHALADARWNKELHKYLHKITLKTPIAREIATKIMNENLAKKEEGDLANAAHTPKGPQEVSNDDIQGPGPHPTADYPEKPDAPENVTVDEAEAYNPNDCAEDENVKSEPTEMGHTPHGHSVDVDRERTFGEKRIRTTFNPGNNDKVQNLKEFFAHGLDRLEDMRPNTHSQNESAEYQRLISLSQTYLEMAAMFAVKAATL